MSAATQEEPTLPPASAATGSPIAYSVEKLPALLRQRFAERPAQARTRPENESQQDLAQGGVAPRQENDAGLFDNISLEEAATIYSVVRDLRPTNTFEIGFCCGVSGMAILQALEDIGGAGRHYACDPYQTPYAGRRGVSNVEAAGLSHRLEFFEDFPENIVAKVPRTQFCFIDASHLYDLSILDFVLADKRLEVGGVVAFHDLWMPSLQKTIRYILSNRAYEIYRPPGYRRPQRLKTHVASLIGDVLSTLPASQRIFAPELLKPWSSWAFGKMGFLRKVADDQRDWRHHKVF